ncbi:MAG: hypothetical protein AB7F39_06715 [Variibacter sp.]
MKKSSIERLRTQNRMLRADKEQLSKDLRTVHDTLAENRCTIERLARERDYCTNETALINADRRAKEREIAHLRGLVARLEQGLARLEGFRDRVHEIDNQRAPASSTSTTTTTDVRGGVTTVEKREAYRPQHTLAPSADPIFACGSDFDRNGKVDWMVSGRDGRLRPI